METAFMMFPVQGAITPDELARRVEERGHVAVYFPEHTHLPAKATVPPERHTGGANRGRLPREYARAYDLIVSMTAAVMATQRIRVGSAICLIVQRDPIITANAIATLDQLSGGRIEFGVGAGWNADEMANHGTDIAQRFVVMRERVEAMKAIWTREEATYQGRHVRFERIWCWPKPAQFPHPPVLVGGTGPRVLERVKAYGDAWMPTHNAGNVLERMPEARAALGTDVPVFVASVPADPDVIAGYAEAGVRRVIHLLPSATTGEVERAMDRFEAAVRKAIGD